jgi:hypothetical protein
LIAGAELVARALTEAIDGVDHVVLNRTLKAESRVARSDPSIF